MYDILIKNITKRYDDKLALDNVSLEIKPGEIFGLLGPNGAGKTTLIHILCGLIPMDNGEVFVGGISVKKDPEAIKSRIGFVPQEIVLFDNLSVNDNLDYFGRLYGLGGTTLKKRMDEALKIAELSERRKDKVKKLSGGMKRRLNLACAIMHHPDILVLDEPTVGVDPQSRNHILESVRQMNRERKMTVVYTSHYMEEVEALCDRLMILDLGKELVSGTKKEILRTITSEGTMMIRSDAMPSDIASVMNEIEGVKKATVQEDLLEIIFGDNCEENIMHALLTNNVRIKTITMEEPNLETVFLSITGKALRD
ncbi:MAG: ABC transporter ATP-binding protein [Thermotogota bacterium]